MDKKHQPAARTPHPLLRKTYTEKAFDKRIVKGLYLPQDRELIRGTFAADEQGIYRLRTDLDESMLKRANVLAKQIRDNRGSLKTGRVVALLLILAAVIVFNILFKNVLLTRAGENALQSVFEARAEIRGLDLRLLHGTLHLDGVSVADRDRPFRNVFEIGPTVLDISLLELLKGNLVAHTLSVRNIRWNTERADSGALPGVTSQRADSVPAEPRGIAAMAVLGLQPDDAEAFLLQHYEQLSIPQLASDVGRQLESAADRLGERFDDTTAQLDELTTAVQRLQTVQPRQIRDLETAATTLRDAQQLTNQVKIAAAGIETDLTLITDDAAAAVALGDVFVAAITADMQYLTDRITDVTDDPTGFLLDIVGRLLQERFSDLFHLLGRARELEAHLAHGQPTERRTPFRPGGADIIYPSVSWPRFYLGHAEISFGTEESGDYHEGVVRAISSSPRLVGRPTELQLQTLRGTLRHTVSGNLALHQTEGPLMQLDYTGLSLPVAAQADWGQVKLKELAGPTDVQTSMLLERDWGIQGTAEVSIRDPRFALETGVSTLDRLLGEAAAAADEIGASFEYTASDNRITSLRGSTTLDRHLAAGLRGYMAEQQAAFETRLRGELNTVVARRRETLAPLETRLVGLSESAHSELERARNYRREAEAMLAELENRVAELRAEAERRAREEVEREVESLIERTPLPGINTERIPRFR